MNYGLKKFKDLKKQLLVILKKEAKTTKNIMETLEQKGTVVNWKTVNRYLTELYIDKKVTSTKIGGSIIWQKV